MTSSMPNPATTGPIAKIIPKGIFQAKQCIKTLVIFNFRADIIRRPRRVASPHLALLRKNIIETILCLLKGEKREGVVFTSFIKLHCISQL